MNRDDMIAALRIGPDCCKRSDLDKRFKMTGRRIVFDGQQWHYWDRHPIRRQWWRFRGWLRGRR